MPPMFLTLCQALEMKDKEDVGLMLKKQKSLWKVREI